MMMMWISSLVVLFSVLFSVSCHETPGPKGHWNYSNQDDWKSEHPSCGGSRQSPIDIEDICFPTNLTRVNSTLQMNLIKYNVDLPSNKMKLENNGHTAQMSLNGTADQYADWAPKLSGTAVNNGVYQFTQLHFHWHENDTQSSEHAIHGSRKALEMHLVHWNVKYGSFAKAGNKPDGVVVLGILFDVNFDDNKYLYPIVDYLGNVTAVGSHVEIDEPFLLQPLLPDTYHTFYRYQGSLTTPPCSESVTWLLVTQIQKISYRQLHEFACLHNEKGGNVGNTNRQLQPLNDRVVETSSNAHCTTDEMHEKEKKKRKANRMSLVERTVDFFHQHWGN